MEILLSSASEITSQHAQTPVTGRRSSPMDSAIATGNRACMGVLESDAIAIASV